MVNNLEIISKDEFETLYNEDYYNNARWSYFEQTINELEKLEDINRVLEIGPYKTPYVHYSDIIDLIDYRDSIPFEIGEIFIHDCSVVPFPFKDKEYDLVIASHSLEHLGSGFHGKNQIKIFEEISRISRMAIITLPYSGLDQQIYIMVLMI